MSPGPQSLLSAPRAFRAGSDASPGSAGEPVLADRSPGRPFCFRPASVWRHPEPLLAVLRRDYGHLDLRGLEGSYGWLIKYDQQARADAAGIRTLGDFLDRFGRPGPGPLPYLMHLSVNRYLPELRDRFVTPPEFRPNWVTARWLDRLGGPELFLGPPGSGFGPFHQDHASVHVGFWQLAGEKQFILFPPEDGPHLYRYPGAQFPWQLRNSRIRAVDWQDHRKFPRLRHAHPVSVVLRAGEALFLPADWWHSTLNRTWSVSYSIRIVNHTNVLRTLGQYALGIPRLVRRWLALPP